MSVKKKPELRFKAFIKAFGGTRKLALHLGCTEWCVFNWQKGGSCPEVRTIIKLIALSREIKGHELDFDTIYKECTRAQVLKKVEA